MDKITSGKHTFEIVDSVPKGYQIWSIGNNMVDGYLPLVQVGGYNGHTVNTETMKAIKIEGAQIILEAVGYGQYTIEEMERYIKRYKNSKTLITQRHVERLKEALKIMYLINWDSN